MPTPTLHLATLTLVALATAPADSHAADFAAKGARATLSVDYSYEAAGKKSDKYDLREWKVLRTLRVDAQLTAGAAAPMASLQPMDAGQQARLQQQTAQMNKFAEQSAPMMASAQAIMQKCGDDEKCMEREAMRLGQSLSGTPQLDATLKAGKETAAVLAPGANRYQAWQGQSQAGNYRIEEKLHIVHADPICIPLPKQRCTRDEVRRGAGALANTKGSAALVEVDAGKATLTLMLPTAHEVLGYTETITTDEPEGTHSTPTPKGPQQRQLAFKPVEGQVQVPTFTVPLSGGWRNQSGVQTFKFTGPNEQGGAMTVRWRFQVQ
ncbi:hypothetical protein [Roseateles sp.]|uniref:hypothetical protein n=1 Tax=Roseateles sp. TaxID=1971397 RepID=UPI0039E91701